MPEAAYPRVDDASRAYFRLAAPEAKDVKVDICGKKYDMTRDDKGVWSVSTDPLVPGFHYYFLLVDGVSVVDPASETFYGCGRMAGGIEIPESKEEAAYYTFNKDVPHGRVSECKYYSDIVRATRRRRVDMLLQARWFLPGRNCRQLLRPASCRPKGRWLQRFLFS